MNYWVANLENDKTTLYDYLSNRQQRTKINHANSSWEEVIFGVPQGYSWTYIIQHLLSDLFLIIGETESVSYADDNTIYDAENIIEDVILSLKESFKKLFKLFSDNEMQGNSGKCHLILSADGPSEMQIGESLFKTTNFDKLLGIKIDSQLAFDKHIKTICKKSNDKLRALARVIP